MRFFFLLLILTVTFSCNKKENATVNDNVIIIDSTKLTKKELSKITYLNYGVDAKSKSTLESWLVYNKVSNAIEAVKVQEFNIFKIEDEEFNVILQDLETTIPSKINSEAVKSRILVLKTKLLKVREALNLKTTKKSEKLLAIKELFQSFSYLTFQVNKKFEKEAQNIIKPN